MTRIQDLAKESRSLAPYDQKSTIDSILVSALHSYRCYRPLFTCRHTHNNAHLNNFLFDKKTVWTLDLSHIRQDIILSDLASLIISCLFFHLSPEKIKKIIKDYLTKDHLKTEYLQVLNVLIQLGLIKEYFKNTRRERTPVPSAYPSKLTKDYRSQLSKRKELIIRALNERLFQ